MHHPSTPRRDAGRRMRVATIALGVLAIGSVGVAHADTKASITCRKTLSNELSKLAQTGFKNADKCHKIADKVCTPDSNRADCNDVSTPAFDIKLKYSAGKTKAIDKINGKCLTGDPVLSNYTGGSITGAVFPLVDESVAANSNLTQGDNDLLCDKAQIKCLDTIGKSRTSIVKEILKDSVKCQKEKDKVATTFGPVDPTCIDAADKSIPKAIEKINKSCTDVDPNDVGTCSPLPGCVIDNAVLTGQNLVKDIFSVQPVTPVCGNGSVEAGEQCDDGNTSDGDGCNSVCELEGRTCTNSFGSSIIGTRTVKVSINTSTPLSGLQVALDYPQFEAGIPGVGTSSIVASRFTTLQTADLSGINDTDTDANVALVKTSGGFVSGDLFSIAMDNCAPLSLTLCNRNQNVTNCCNNASDPNQFQVPPGSEKCASKECSIASAGKVCYKSATPGAACTTDADCSKVCSGGPNGGAACSVTSECPTAFCLGSCQQKICTSDLNCGGGACSGGANNGASCTVASECPGGTCAANNVGSCGSITCGTDPTACFGGGNDPEPQFGLCVFKCPGNPPVCGIGHFGPFKCVGGANAGASCSVDSQCPGSTCQTTVGQCDNLNGACPGDNVCVAQVTTHSCNVSSPVDSNGQPVAGVTCSVAVTEAP